MSSRGQRVEMSEEGKRDNRDLKNLYINDSLIKCSVNNKNKTF